jgi:hypothetical protein
VTRAILLRIAEGNRVWMGIDEPRSGDREGCASLPFVYNGQVEEFNDEYDAGDAGFGMESFGLCLVYNYYKATKMTI